MKKTVGVVFGGTSHEREVTIKAALDVITAIDNLEGYKCWPIFVTPQSTFRVGFNLRTKETFVDKSIIEEKTLPALFYRNKNGLYICTNTKKVKIEQRIDIAFIIAHGINDEDGTLAGFFNAFNIPYTGTDVCASAIGMNKYITKCLLKHHDFRVVDGYYLHYSEYMRYLKDKDPQKLEQAIQEIVRELKGYPLFPKPVDSGSSVGIDGKASNFDELKSRIDMAFEYTNGVLIEKFIDKSKEINCCVIGDFEEQIVSKCVEIHSKSDFHTINEKYPPDWFAPGKKMGSIDSTIIAKISPKKAEEIRELSRKVYNLFGCTGIVRVDFFLDKKGDVYINEINTIPGSLSKGLWEKSGIKFKDLIKKQIEIAEKSYESRQRIKESDPIKIKIK